MATVPRIDRNFAQLGTSTRNTLTAILNLLRGGLSLHENLRQQLYTATFGAGYVADAAQVFDTSALGLSFTPVGLIEVARDTSGAVVYSTPADRTAWTSSSLTVRSNTAGMQSFVLWLI